MDSRQQDFSGDVPTNYPGIMTQQGCRFKSFAIDVFVSEKHHNINNYVTNVFLIERLKLFLQTEMIPLTYYGRIITT